MPVHDLSAPSASATVTFRNIFSVREIGGKKLLVNDGVRRRLVMLDASMSNPGVVLDSTSEGGNSYGPRASPLIPFLADSSLFIDAPSLSLVVIDPNGKVARVMSVPRPNDLRFLAGSPSGVDAKGNLLYRVEASQKQLSLNQPNAGNATVVMQPQDSAPVSRANFERRSIDTVGYVRLDNGIRTTTTRTADALITKLLVNPLVTIDDWTVLSDGTIAFVRGHDYHVDVIRPDGRALSGAKLPFDWKRLTDADKQHLIDSARTAIDQSQATAKENKPTAGGADAARNEMSATMAMAAMSRGDAGGGNIASRSFKLLPPITEFVPISEIGEYYPPIRAGAAKADADGNLWILPTTSAQSKSGELVYDVIDNRGALKKRVRVPVGRSIAGFGKGGVVYLMFRDETSEWHLERRSFR
ncbi:MAG: hypothetical protein ABI852_01660 [Gemmatimonadaceae bacterium]